jgi:hypothetical protein
VNTVRNKAQGKHRPPRKPGSRSPARRAGRSSRGLWIVVAVVIAIGTAGIFAVASGSKSGSGDALASSALVDKVSSVPASVFGTVGVGSASGAPKAITAPALTVGGKPHIVYVGAEYCPYCATERWPMVVALSRFGTFSGLKTTHSSSTDTFPDTQTFSFHGATYTSKWISFTGIETQTNERQGDGYAPLDTLTAQEQALVATYDKAPYVGTSNTSGGIPFIDFAGRFAVGGATYDPGVLQGKSADEIAGALADPASAISQGVIGAANTFTASICALTKDQPARVCSDSAIQQIEQALK